LNSSGFIKSWVRRVAAISHSFMLMPMSMSISANDELGQLRCSKGMGVARGSQFSLAAFPPRRGPGGAAWMFDGIACVVVRGNSDYPVCGAAAARAAGRAAGPDRGPCATRIEVFWVGHGWNLGNGGWRGIFAWAE